PLLRQHFPKTSHRSSTRQRRRWLNLAAIMAQFLTAVDILPAEIIKLPGRSLIERNDFELLIKLEQQGQLAITDHLPHRRLLLGDHGQPAAHPFLDRDNGHTYDFGCRNRIKSFNHATATFALGVFQELRMVRVKEDHSANSPRRAASRSASRIRWHSSSTLRMNSLSRNMPTTLRQSLRDWPGPFVAMTFSKASTRLARDSKVKSFIAVSSRYSNSLRLFYFARFTSWNPSLGVIPRGGRWGPTTFPGR